MKPQHYYLNTHHEATRVLGLTSTTSVGKCCVNVILKLCQALVRSHLHYVVRGSRSTIQKTYSDKCSSKDAITLIPETPNHQHKHFN